MATLTDRGNVRFKCGQSVPSLVNQTLFPNIFKPVRPNILERVWFTRLVCASISRMCDHFNMYIIIHMYAIVCT